MKTLVVFLAALGFAGCGQVQVKPAGALKEFINRQQPTHRADAQPQPRNRDVPVMYRDPSQPRSMAAAVTRTGEELKPAAKPAVKAKPKQTVKAMPAPAAATTESVAPPTTAPAANPWAVAPTPTQQ
jgi:hypothetical protein